MNRMIREENSQPAIKSMEQNKGREEMLGIKSRGMHSNKK